VRGERQGEALLSCEQLRERVHVDAGRGEVPSQRGVGLHSRREAPEVAGNSYGVLCRQPRPRPGQPCVAQHSRRSDEIFEATGQIGLPDEVVRQRERCRAVGRLPARHRPTRGAHVVKRNGLADEARGRRRTVPASLRARVTVVEPSARSVTRPAPTLQPREDYREHNKPVE
jgi:hypothetical protein